MERIINYDELPRSKGQSIYFRMETDPKLYISLMSKGYKIINHIYDSNESTIYVTGKRQDRNCNSYDEYKNIVDTNIQNTLKEKGIVKPNTYNFSIRDLINYKYKIPFVLKNENQNGGREKFLINTEEDYKKLILACTFLVNKKRKNDSNDLREQIDYNKYLNLNFTVQDYIPTPSKYNTTVRILTSSSNDLLYAALKYKEPSKYIDDTTLLGYLLGNVFPLSTNSIVSNTLSGGKNVLIGESNYLDIEKSLLIEHNINSNQFSNLVDASKNIHAKYKSELGIICGFDYIYNKEREKWFLLEYHSRPMVGDYSKRQNIYYESKEDKMTAEGRVRATALNLTLKKTRLM